ncbi:MAG: hypothetical protein GY795_46600 [Desulfobacterales bacterium]|nr:hypothetical protein [Desulfobacterales bacterium]
MNDVDNDEDGYTENQGDCNDSDAFVFPEATEICGDGIDQDCDGNVDCNDSDCSEDSNCNPVGTVTIKDADGNAYEAGGLKSVIENINLQKDNDTSLMDYVSSEQNPITSGFVKLDIQSQEEPDVLKNSSVKLIVKYSQPPNRIIVYDKATGEAEYRPFYNTEQGNTLIVFESGEDASFLPVREQGADQRKAGNYRKKFNILKNDGNNLVIKLDLNYDNILNLLVMLEDDRILERDVSGNSMIEFDVGEGKELNKSGAYRFMIYRTLSNMEVIKVWEQDIFAQIDPAM